MRFTLCAVLVAALCFVSQAQEPVPRIGLAAETERSFSQKELLDRIDALEKRLAKLEESISRRGRPSPTPTPYTDPYRQPPQPPNSSPQPPTAAPNPYQRNFAPTPTPPTPQYAPIPNSVPSQTWNQQPSRVAPTPKESVPKGWQRFEFNGQSFYIVPIDKANQPAEFRR